jgi:hypothetical protein
MPAAPMAAPTAPPPSTTANDQRIPWPRPANGREAPDQSRAGVGGSDSGKFSSPPGRLAFHRCNSHDESRSRVPTKVALTWAAIRAARNASATDHPPRMVAIAPPRTAAPETNQNNCRRPNRNNCGSRGGPTVGSDVGPGATEGGSEVMPRIIRNMGVRSN